MKLGMTRKLYLVFYTGVGRKGLYVKAPTLNEARRIAERQPHLKGESIITIQPIGERGIHVWPIVEGG